MVVAPITLADDDVAGVVVTPTALEIEEGSSSTYTAVLRSQPSGNVTFGMIALLAGTNVSVEPLSLTFTTLNWSGPQTVTVTTTPDEDRTDDVVTLTHTVRGGGYGGVSVDDVVVTILETARLPLTLSVSPYVIREDGGVSTVTVSSTGGVTSESDETIELSFTGTATRGVDYLVGSETLVLSTGQTSVTTTVTGVFDTESEVSEAVVVRASRDGRAVGSQVITLTDSLPPVVTLALTPTSVSEYGGVSSVTASLSHATSQAVTLTVSAAPVSPAVAGDFELSPNRVLTIPPGSTESMGGVTVTAVKDGINGPDKTVTVSATVTEGTGVAAPDPVTLTIRDFDPIGRVVFVLSPRSVSENGGVSTLTATLDPPAFSFVSFEVGPAESDDFTLSRPRRLRIPRGETTSSTSVTITAVDNDVYGPDKTVKVGYRFFTGDWARPPRDATLTIEEDDRPPTVTLVLSPPRVGEVEGVSTVTATLSHPMTSQVRLEVSAEAVPPAFSGHFELSENRVLTIREGQTESEGTVTITSLNDPFDDPEKEVTVSATVLEGGVSAPASQTLTIEGENGGVSTVTATLSGASSEAVTVTVSATAVSPGVSGDFTQSSTALTIAAGSTTSTGTVTLTAVDNVFDAPTRR